MFCSWNSVIWLLNSTNSASTETQMIRLQLLSAHWRGRITARKRATRKLFSDSPFVFHRGKKVLQTTWGSIPLMPSEFTYEILLLVFVQSWTFAHVWMHKLNTFIMPDLLLCKPPAINIALMRSVTDIFYSMRHL